MLVAYGPDGRAVVADETPLEELRIWSRGRLLHCPNCRGIVHVRGGTDTKTHVHFAHQKGECAWSTESESVRHASGKRVLAQWLHAQFPQAIITLEERLPEPNRIADVFVVHDNGQRWAVEFQCAPLDIEEWRMRHDAYRQAGITDTWIIGNNRREKQEAFIEAILAMAHEILFLDPQVTPPRIWLRWPVPRAIAQEWQNATQVRPGQGYKPSLDSWVGRLGYGASLIGTLPEIRLDRQAHLLHPMRTRLEARTQLLQRMSVATTVEVETLNAYLQQSMEEDAIRIVMLPLLRAYLRDPELLLRYNYGRGQLTQPLDTADMMRVQKAGEWLKSLEKRGFPTERLRELMKDLPFVGPYAAFASYAETLLELTSSM